MYIPSLISCLANFLTRTSFLNFYYIIYVASSLDSTSYSLTDFLKLDMKNKVSDIYTTHVMMTYTIL